MIRVAIKMQTNNSIKILFIKIQFIFPLSSILESFVHYYKDIFIVKMQNSPVIIVTMSQFSLLISHHLSIHFKFCLLRESYKIYIFLMCFPFSATEQKILILRNKKREVHPQK